MCGVFGFVANDGRRADEDSIVRIARVTQRRGAHAFGLAWIDGAGRLKTFKRQGPISNELGIVAMAAAEARMLIGHCRYTTSGPQDANINNHPHPADGGWIVHNGMIHNWQRTVRRFGLLPNSECDSEVLGLLIEQGSGSVLERCARAARRCAGGPLVMLGLWHRPNRLVMVRDGGQPLHTADTREGTYLASLADGLPGDVRELQDGSAMLLGGKSDAKRFIGLHPKQREQLFAF